MAETSRDVRWKIDPSGTEGLAQGHNHLLLIGIDQYQHVGRLANAVSDAQAVGALLQEKYRFDPERITSLYDTEATGDQIARTFRRLIQEVKQGDNLLVYYSGHGHYDQLLDEAYWVPVEARFQAEREYISYDYLMRVIKRIKSRHTVFIVDSCYSGAVIVKSKDLKAERFERDPSRWMLASGRNEVVPDGVTGGNSPFAEQLLDLLDRYALEGLRMGTLADKLTTAVTYNSPQTPIGRPLYGVGDKGGEFVFHPKRNQAADYQAAMEAGTAQALKNFLKAYPDAPQNAELQARIAQREDQEAWAEATTRNTIPAYRGYRQRFPQGAHRSEALDRIGQLEADRDWKRALRQDTITAYERFLDRHPYGSQRPEAESAIERLLAEAQEAEAKRLAEEKARQEEAARQQAEAERIKVEKRAQDRQAQEEEALKRKEAEQRQAEEATKKREEERLAQEAQTKEAEPRKTQDPLPPWHKQPLARGALIGLSALLLFFSLYWIIPGPPEISSETFEGDSLLAAQAPSSGNLQDESPTQDKEQALPDPEPAEESLQALTAQGYDILEPWVSDRAAYRAPDGRMGLVDREGNRLGGTYKKVEDLASGYAVFHDEQNRRGYLSLQSGEVVIKAQYASAGRFDGRGRARVRTQDGHRQIINTQGECIQDCKTEEPPRTANTPPTSAPSQGTTDLPIPLPKMIRIPGGSFQMGSNEGFDNEKPVHPVSISTFYLAETEVTFEQYDYFCGQTGRNQPDDEGWGRGKRPVINVSWEDAQAYCQWVSEQTGQRYRLPTEAEWEYAAGGGASGRTKWAGTSSGGSLGSYAVYGSNSGGKTSPVKSKRPNSLGLYDMSGNVWEWCSDWYGENYYASSPQQDPKGPSSGSDRVYRGGGWVGGAWLCRVANRGGLNPSRRGNNLGFRLAR